MNGRLFSSVAARRHFEVRCLLALVLLALAPFGRCAEARRQIRIVAPAPKPEAAPAATAATLRWNNGETLAGEPIDASATELTWQSPLFEDPLVLRWDALHRIDRTLEPVTTSEPFSIAMRDGSHLFGDVVAVSDAAITIRSTRHGEAVLKRSEVLSARRLQGGDLIAGGPGGESLWRIVTDTTRNASARTAPAPLLRTGAGGALVLPYWNRGATLNVAIPEMVEVEFRVRAARRPDFQLSLGAGGTQRLRVETWDEDLVLVAGRGFKTIRKLADADREVSLRIFWDRRAQKCSVFTPTGDSLGAWDVPPDTIHATPQVLLQNKGRELSLELLRVRKWDGKPPAKIAGKLPRVEFADGNIVEGTLGAGPSGSLEIRTDGADAVATHPLREVEAIVFSADLPKVRESEATLAYADGTLLFGRIASIQDGRTFLATTFTDLPLPAQLSGLRQLRKARQGEAERLPPDADTLILPNLTLHGKLASTGEARPRWLPVGGVRPARLSGKVESEIRRTFPPGPAQPGAAALFYMNTGDVLAGSLRGLDRTGVEIESSFVESQRLPIESLDAVQFGGAGERNLQGFGDSGWHIVKGDATTVRMTSDNLDMDAGTAVGHASAMHSNEIRFSFSCDGFGVLRLRLFCAGTDAAQSTGLLIGSLGNRLYSGLESGEGQFDGQRQLMTEQGKPVAVRLVISERQVELFLNEEEAQKFTIVPGKRIGAGLLIEPASVWGNQVQPVKLKDFAATSGPGRAWLPDVSPDAKAQALTVPRFRKDDPPRHALLATNSDVLRGEIEALTASHFGFRSGLENLRVPRDRVRAAIWLKPPDPEAPPPEPQSPVARALEQKLTRRIHYTAASFRTLIALLEREFSGLKFRLPPQEPATRVSMRFGDQTLAEALEEICGRFRMRYHIEADTIVLEAVAPPEAEVTEKVYQLKPSAFPPDGSAQHILASRGVPFTDRASIVWQPKSGHLTVSDAPAIHEKLAAVLTAQFGATLASPTHWLLLTSGARIALAVEKFEPEIVTGRHPTFGICRIPLAQIHTIRTTAPEPTPAMTSLADWRLIHAPEPVLPETGGENSPALGKAAHTFKLPLLAGGTFDLAQHHGRIVVLDFWATWCGPCIKSLPALIEAISAFPADRVTLLGVNQSEPAAQVQRFLETRAWNFPVALDAGQKVARQYGVEGIPHTVIVGPDGHVAWVKTGFSPDGAAEVAKAVQQLLTENPKLGNPNPK